MEPYQQRVVDEKNELDTKRGNLMAFFSTSVFLRLDQGEKDRLRTQHLVMGIYSDILNQRIEAFTA